MKKKDSKSTRYGGQDGQAKKNIYHVSEDRGPYYKIQDAINVAKPNSTILVASGYYKDNIKIS